MKYMKRKHPISTVADNEALQVEIEVPQVESLDEAVRFHGDIWSLLAYLNDTYKWNAAMMSRAFLRAAIKDGRNDAEQITKEVKEIAKSYQPSYLKKEDER